MNILKKVESKKLLKHTLNLLISLQVIKEREVEKAADDEEEETEEGKERKLMRMQKRNRKVMENFKKWNFLIRTSSYRQENL